MPFTIQKNEKGKFCVYKKDANDKPTGKTLGCHAKKKEAIAQIGAVESELKRRGKKSSDVNFVVWDEDTEVDFDAQTTTHSVSDNGTIWIDAESGELIWREETGDTINMGKTSEDSVAKAESIDAYRNKVADAWYDLKFYDIYTVEIFDEFIIVRDYNQKTYYKVAYVLSGDAIEFVKQNEWQEVKLKKEWVEKSLNLQDRLDFTKYILDEDEEEPEQIAVDSRYAIKSLGGNRVGAYAILWGDEDTKDLDEEYFTEETRDMKAIFDAIGVLPFIVHHAMEDVIKSFVAGAVDVLEEDDIGLWWEATVKEFEAYKKYVKPLISKKMAFTSTGTLPAAKRVTKSGFISRWPVAEVTATWLPAEYRMLEHPINDIKSAYQEMGIEIEDKLADYDDSKKTTEDTDNVDQGVEKARLKELVDQEFIKLGLLQLEIGE
jgi:hypothetical protein